jgi:hypothetical protein
LETLKAIKQKEKDKFIDNIKKIFNMMDKYEKIDSQKAKEIFGFIIYYILITRDDTDEYELKEIDIKRGDLIMTRGRQLYEDGIKKGKMEGMKLGEYLKAKDTVKKLLSKKLDKKQYQKLQNFQLNKLKKLKKK